MTPLLNLFDEHFTVLWANDYFYQLIGYEKEEYEALFHNHVDEYYKDDPESIAFMAEIIMDAYKNNEPGYEFECPMHVKGGDTIWIRVTSRFTDESFKGIPVIYTIYTDITKLKEMQQLLENQSSELSAALEMEERANRAKSDFLSQMSHDIRTPMNAIIGMTNIATMHLGDTKKVQDCLKKISSSSQHLLGLINDVLDMSKIESGNIVLNPERTSLPAVLENASKFTAEQGNIIFEIEELACDLSEHALLQFTFADTGTGIQPEFLPHIFDVFTRERDSRVDKTEGSGLGMAITKKLTELLGGTIYVKSEPGKRRTPFQILHA